MCEVGYWVLKKKIGYIWICWVGVGEVKVACQKHT